MWIEKENGMRYAYLIQVDPSENADKFYEMQQLDTNWYQATWGRVGAKNPQTKRFPMWEGRNCWASKYRSKTKSYKCQTKLRVVDNNTNHYVIDHEDRLVREIFTHLQNAASQHIKANYTVQVTAVSPQMIHDAQKTINQISSFLDQERWVAFNNSLIDLMHIIPRKMKNVQDHIVDLKQSNPKEAAQAILENEQELLDTMRAQVVVGQSKGNLLDMMGITARGIADHEQKYLHNLLLGEKKDFELVRKFKGAIALTHHVTENRFKKWVGAASNKNMMNLWHGSRTPHWLSILSSGLVLYPANAHITGKMFGYGLYFADRAKKSVGYTSLRGSYWAGGGDSTGYIALFQVHTGRQWTIYKHKSSHKQLKETDIKEKGYDSVFSPSGYDLLNSEYIIYNRAQCTIRYIVKLGE